PRGQAALVAGGLVLVDQATRAEAVEQRLGDDVGSLGGGGVVGVERLQHLLDRGAQLRALGRVAGVAHDGLLGALLGRLDVGHGESWKLVWSKGMIGWRRAETAAGRQESMGDSWTCVNPDGPPGATP